jgi:lauroyl/myristoyl acyltransferase
MSLKTHLQTREHLERVARESWRFGRQAILESGMAYYDAHPEDVDLVRRNLEFMGLDRSAEALGRALEGIVVHYFEKLFVMTKGYEAHWVVENRVEVGDALEALGESRDAGRGIFLGQSHFGGTYLLVPVLISAGFDVTFVALFPGPVFDMLASNIDEYTRRWSTGKANLVNVADREAMVPEIMIGSLRSGECVMNVFDENNAFSRPVEILGRRIHGGSGMDRILGSFGEDRVDVLTPFLVRTDEESFRLEVDRHSLGPGDVIQSMYDSLGRRVGAHPEQWYFLQELHHSLEPITR